LKPIEQLNIDSGIRKFCTTICKGICCAHCEDKEKKCHEKLTCTSFICGPLKDVIFDHIIQERMFAEMNLIIWNGFRPFYMVRKMPPSDMYFKKIPKLVIDKIKFPPEILFSIMFFNTEKIKRKINKLMSLTQKDWREYYDEKQKGRQNVKRKFDTCTS